MYNEFEQADLELEESQYKFEEYGLYLLNQLENPAIEIFETDKPFSETLYQGFCAEYHLIADLYRIGLEGTKPAADFGFDVVSTNFRKAMYEQQQQETYLFQVKSRYIEDHEWIHTGDNRSIEKEFFVYTNDMLKMIMTKNCYLVLYLIEKDTGRIVQYIWLSNYQLDELLLCGKFDIKQIDEKHYFKLTLSIQEQNNLTVTKIKDLIINDMYSNISNYSERKTRLVKEEGEMEKYPFDWIPILNLKENLASQTDNCPICGDKLNEKKGRFGKFLGCNSYPKCKYTVSIPKNK